MTIYIPSIHLAIYPKYPFSQSL